MNTLTYQVCNLIREQNEKGRFSPGEIAKDMLDFFSEKTGDVSNKEFMNFLLNSLEKEKNEILRLFIQYTLNFFTMSELYHREDSEEKKVLMEMVKPLLKDSFENIMNFLKSKEAIESLKELSVTHQIVKSLNKKE
tara:strand:- start:411 stop:818 length:408 start_codon:yes stop_codon:yes gene_type:complete